MIGKILTQIAFAVGVDVIKEKVLPKVAEKAKKKLDKMKKEKAEEEAREKESQEEDAKSTKVYAATWKE